MAVKEEKKNTPASAGSNSPCPGSSDSWPPKGFRILDPREANKPLPEQNSPQCLKPIRSLREGLRMFRKEQSEAGARLAEKQRSDPHTLRFNMNKDFDYWK